MLSHLLHSAHVECDRGSTVLVVLQKARAGCLVGRRREQRERLSVRELLSTTLLLLHRLKFIAFLLLKFPKHTNVYLSADFQNALKVLAHVRQLRLQTDHHALAEYKIEARLSSKLTSSIIISERINISVKV